MLLVYGQSALDGPEDTAFRREIRESGELVSVEGLADAVNARSVQVREGAAVVRPGGRDDLAGYVVVDCENLDRAVELAARCPAARDAWVEVWPLMDQGGTEM